MFDLFRSRAKVVRYMLGGLLMIVALSMVVTLIPGFGSGGGGRDDQVIAEVGKHTITLHEVQKQIQAALRNRSFPQEMASIYVPQMVDQIITEYGMLQKADDLGFQVTEEELAKAIQRMMPHLFQGGQFAGKEAYEASVARFEMSIPEFEAGLRRQITLTRLQNLIAEGVVVSPAEVEEAYRLRNEKAKLEYIAAEADKFRSVVSVSPEEVQKVYEANRSGFQMPEKRTLDLLVIDEAQVAAGIALPEEELRRAYQASQEQFRTPERVQVRHILLKTTDKSPDEVQKIQARANDLLKQVRSGGDFAALAQKNSEDPGSAVKGGDLGWVVRGQTVPAFETAAFSLKPNEISNVVKTEYGFHILQLLAKEDAHLKPFEEVKDQIALDLKRRQVFERMQQLSDQAHAELTRNPMQASQIAGKLGIGSVRAEKVGPGDTLPVVGASADLSSSFSGLAKGGVTPVIQTGPNRLVVAAVVDVLPARPSELSEVADQIRQQLIAGKAAELARKKAEEAFQIAQSGGNLAAAAKAAGLEVKTTQEFTRTGAADGIGGASILLDAFTKPVGTVFRPSAAPHFICKIVSQTPADMSQIAAQREALRGELKTQKARERYELVQDSVRESLSKSGKIKVHKQVVDRLVGSYRG